MGRKSRYQFYCSKRLLVIFLTGVTCAFALVFVLGFLVGKGSDGRKAYESKKGGSAKEERPERNFLAENTERDAGRAPSDMALTFHQSLMGKEAVSPNKTPATKTQHGTAENKAKKKKAEREDGKARPLSGYTLQVGSFQKKERALELAEELRSKGYDTYIISSNIPMKGLWHRVRVGHFNTLEEAKKTQLTVEMKERLPAYVTFAAH